MRSLRGSAIRLVAFVVASSLVTWWIAGQITGRDARSTYELSAQFDDVSGLRDGDEVRLAGIRVGRVTGIDVDAGEADVRFTVDEDVELPADSTVAVRWRNLIGQRFLGLEPGTAGRMLGDGDRVENAEDVVDLGQLVNQLSPLARSVGPEQVNRVLTALVAAFEGNEGTYDGILADLDSLTAMLADRDQLLGQMLADYETITGAIASRDEQIAAMVTNTTRIAETLDASDALVERTLGELARVSSGAADLLGRTRADVGSILDQLVTITGTTVANLDTVEEAIDTLPGMFEAVMPAINRGAFLRVNLLCISAGPGPCPHPLLFFEAEEDG